MPVRALATQAVTDTATVIVGPGTPSTPPDPDPVLEPPAPGCSDGFTVAAEADDLI